MERKQINPAVSVIIPVYNKEKYLRRCFDSVLNQTFKDFELILVNDGSKDGSLKICEEYESFDPRVIVIDTPNRGSSSARNTGLSEASGDWIIFFDADDWIDLDMLQNLYEEGIKQNADIIACGIYEDYGNGYRIEHLYPYGNFEPHSEIYRVEMQYSSACNKLVKRKLFDKYDIHFLDGVRMWDDLAVTTRLRFHSRKTIIVNKPFYHYFCAPRESICVSDVHIFPDSQMKVVDFLIKYFNSLSISDPIIKKIIASIKISAKNYIFSTESETSYNQWKYLYKEANNKIMELKFIPIRNRLFYFLLLKISYSTFLNLRNLKRICRRLINFTNID